ncbi:hypothetical protein DHEL01_v209020 [Diaporthe helianthi]|uniref:Uncharacterized protein n=1 Tax=Diaporthe helianthi TaxID=158607 RepID=A0A2P5HQT7_DIAHE|nr:hypothetical protein DHEL01_v209020 [Diaporthe helianthi]
MTNYAFILQLLAVFTISTLTTASPINNDIPVDFVSRDVGNENDLMSAKYPGKYWNSLAEAADTVEYSVPEQLNRLHERILRVMRRQRRSVQGQDGTPSGCGAVTISRSRNQHNKVKGSLKVEHEFGDYSTIGWEIGLNQLSVTISAAKIGALAILLILF